RKFEYPRKSFAHAGKLTRACRTRADNVKMDAMISLDRVARVLAVVLALITAGISVAAPAVPAEAHSVVLDGAKIHYTNYGQGETALLFVHGWSCDETVWSEQAPALAQKMRVITIDLPGHGQSEKPHVAYTTDLYARAIFVVLRDANVMSAVLVAHSNGTAAIRQVFRRFPATVSALVIVEGGLRPFVDAESMEKFIAPLRGDHYEEAAGKFIDGMTHPIKDEKLRDRIKTLMLRTP